MNIKKVDILGQKFKVTHKNKGVSQEMVDTHYGTCNREEHTIWINEKLSTEHKYRTLFHEMGHATFYRSGVSFSGAIPMELEEILVEVFSSQQYEFMRDFIKELLKYEPTYIRQQLQDFISAK